MRDAWGERAALLALVVFGAVLATLIMGGCASSVPVRLAMPMDGYHRELQACDLEASQSAHPGEAYDACLARRGL